LMENIIDGFDSGRRRNDRILGRGFMNWIKLFWITILTLFMSAPGALAQGPSRIAVMANTNGTLLTPTNFFAATSSLVEESLWCKVPEVKSPSLARVRMQ